MMPSASDELRAWATEKFGSIDTHGPQSFLLGAGYILNRGWTWRAPDRDATADEFKALTFLVHEWDYGYIVGTILLQTIITRKDVRRHTATRLYVFGDNMERRGFGGQANAMRGEPNAVGIPTKWRPSRNERDYFTDRVLHITTVRQVIDAAFERIALALDVGQDVVWPKDGIGTGLAELNTRAPKLFLVIEERLSELKAKYGCKEI